MNLKQSMEINIKNQIIRLLEGNIESVHNCFIGKYFLGHTKKKTIKEKKLDFVKVNIHQN